MQLAELLKKVRRIQIAANRKVKDLLVGQYHSVFRGRGMEFEEVREYQPGDDVRNIEWNVTARAHVPYVKVFREERDLTVLFLVDLSATHYFGTLARNKQEIITEICALLMASALRNNDKVGLLLYADQTIRFFKPRKGMSNLSRLLRELLSATLVAQPAKPDHALEFLHRVQKRSAVVFLLSDFIAVPSLASLRSTNARHELLIIRLADPRELELPNVGLLDLEDPVSGERITLDTSSARVRRWFAWQAKLQEVELTQHLQRAGVAELSLRSDQDILFALQRFLQQRERRFR